MYNFGIHFLKIFFGKEQKKLTKLKFFLLQRELNLN